MSRLPSWCLATGLFVFGCAVPLVVGTSADTTVRREAPITPIEYDDVEGTPPNTGKVRTPPFDFILYDAPIREASFRR